MLKRFKSTQYSFSIPVTFFIRNQSGELCVFFVMIVCTNKMGYSTVLPAKSDSGIMFCLQSYQGLKIDRSLVY